MKHAIIFLTTLFLFSCHTTSNIPDAEIYFDSFRIENLILVERRATHRNIKDLLSKVRGKKGNVVAILQINPKGEVLDAKIDKLTTSITDKKFLLTTIKALEDYKFEEDNSAPAIEYMEVILNFGNLKERI
jgi:hypothetical protein